MVDDKTPLTPQGTAVLTVIAFVPAVLDFGALTVGGLPSQERTVHLFNGSPDTLHVTAGSIVCGDPSLSVDDVAGTDLKPASSLEITVKWSPTSTSRLSSFVSVTAANRTARLQAVGQISPTA